MGDNTIILTPEEWYEINAALPDVSELCSRIRMLPCMEDIIDFDYSKLSRVRLSQVCFRDSGNYLYNAHYALGQAIAIRKHFLARSEIERDENHVLADIRSRFFADYVPLLLYSAAEHARMGILEMMGMKAVVQNYPGHYGLKKTLHMLEAQQPNTVVAQAIQQFDASEARKRMWKYRNDWVHNAPMRIETILYNPPRQDFIQHANENFPWDFTLIGAVTSVDFTWIELITLLQEAMQATADFLMVCADEWEKL